MLETTKILRLYHYVKRSGVPARCYPDNKVYIITCQALLPPLELTAASNVVRSVNPCLPKIESIFIIHHDIQILLPSSQDLLPVDLSAHSP